MIDKSGEYWHLYFNETSPAVPHIIVALLNRLFAELAEMPEQTQWFVRRRPTLEYFKDFEKGECVHVYCRISAKPAIIREEPQFLGLGCAHLKAEGAPMHPDDIEGTMTEAFRERQLKAYNDYYKEK